MFVYLKKCLLTKRKNNCTATIKYSVFVTVDMIKKKTKVIGKD